MSDPTTGQPPVIRNLTAREHAAIATFARQYSESQQRAMIGIRAAFNLVAEAFRSVAPLYARHLAEQHQREAVRRRHLWTETRRRARTRTRRRR